MAIDRPLADIIEADLTALITAFVSEGKTIEFKREINDSTPEAKRKLLASIASFANTQGGDIVFGMDAKQGVAAAICPLLGFNPDADCIRLRDFIRAHIEPKLYGFHLQPVPVAAGGHVLILRIPRTWVGAHMVTFNQDNRFYLRDGNGRRIMDVGEVRMAFSAPETLPERMRRLRLDRLSAISSGDLPLALISLQALVFHIVPVKAFDAFHECDIASLAQADKENQSYLNPDSRYPWPLTYDIDGLLKMNHVRNQCNSYVKLFRSGVLEVVDCTSVSEPPPQSNAPMTFSSRMYERNLWDEFPHWLEVMRIARLEPPAFVALSFMGLGGRFPYVAPRYRIDDLRPIRHDPLLLQPRLIETLDADATTTLMPIFNQLWQACGRAASINFDKDGKWYPL
ncbi:MAG: ATP-binding protein [Verrucomicrobiota bacterium]